MSQQNIMTKPCDLLDLDNYWLLLVAAMWLMMLISSIDGLWHLWRGHTWHNAGAGLLWRCVTHPASNIVQSSAWEHRTGISSYLHVNKIPLLNLLSSQPRVQSRARGGSTWRRQDLSATFLGNYFSKCPASGRHLPLCEAHFFQIYQI